MPVFPLAPFAGLPPCFCWVFFFLPAWFLIVVFLLLCACCSFLAFLSPLLHISLVLLFSVFVAAFCSLGCLCPGSLNADTCVRVFFSLLARLVAAFAAYIFCLHTSVTGSAKSRQYILGRREKGTYLCIHLRVLR